jgi:hypothetical protein
VTDEPPDSTSRQDNRATRRVDPLVAKEESAAAAEAARIGGVVPPVSDDPALEPLYEAGEGEEEGWELAEAELIENAAHGDGQGDPELDAFHPEPEADRATTVYGEADEISSTELDEDVGPEKGRPGAP